jgi:hypothetical protein
MLTLNVRPSGDNNRGQIAETRKLGGDTAADVVACTFLPAPMRIGSWRDSAGCGAI